METNLFELQPDRIEVIVRGGTGGTSTHVFSRFMSRDEQFAVSAEAAKQTVKGDEIAFIGDADRAYLAAWEKMIAEVHGYRLKGEPLNLDKARELIPMTHKVAAVKGLDRASVPEDVVQDEIAGRGDIDLGEDDGAVIIEATLGGTVYRLSHVMKPFGTEELASYRRARGGTRATQQRDGSMLLTGTKALRASEDFYDRFVISVEGYCIAGEALDASSPDQRALIPLSHKVLVMNELRRRAEGAVQD